MNPQLSNAWLAAADEILVSYAVAKIYDGDVILTFGFSTTVLNVLLAAQKVRRLLYAYPAQSPADLAKFLCCRIVPASCQGLIQMQWLRIHTP